MDTETKALIHSAIAQVEDELGGDFRITDTDSVISVNIKLVSGEYVPFEITSNEEVLEVEGQYKLIWTVVLKAFFYHREGFPCDVLGIDFKPHLFDLQSQVHFGALGVEEVDDHYLVPYVLRANRYFDNILTGSEGEIVLQNDNLEMFFVAVFPEELTLLFEEMRLIRSSVIDIAKKESTH